MSPVEDKRRTDDHGSPMRRRPGSAGIPGYSDEAYPFPKMHTFLQQIYDRVGPKRMFRGTDITKMPCSWRQCATMFTEELPWLTGKDKTLVMGEAICAWWGWDRNT